MSEFATFGPGGNSIEFAQSKNKSTKQAPLWVKNYGLDSYEYEGGKGIIAKEETFLEIGEEARKHNIHLSLHTPYYISLSSVEEQKRISSCDYILKSARAMYAMTGDYYAGTIVIHAGSAAKLDRKVATGYACDTIEKALRVLEDNSLYGKVLLGIETMGKINQLGTLDEVLEICRTDKTVVPVVDFGHMNARALGEEFKTESDYKRVFDKISEKKGAEYAHRLHCHFSKIEYTTGGEKRHLTFEDSVYGPSSSLLCKAIAELKVAPNIICESDGTMDKDALIMKNEYRKFRETL